MSSISTQQEDENIARREWIRWIDGSFMPKQDMAESLRWIQDVVKNFTLDVDHTLQRNIGDYSGPNECGHLLLTAGLVCQRCLWCSWLSTPISRSRFEHKNSHKVEMHLPAGELGDFSFRYTSPCPSDGSNWDRKSYFTSLSTFGARTYHTATVGPDYEGHVNNVSLKSTDKYARLLRSKNLWPVDPASEQNWSGRGQHAEFQKHERGLVNEILEVCETLGTTATAIVESVKCRRILLARKTLVCRRTIDKEQAISEVAHLARLRHAHILRVIGTYIIGPQLSILLYPVAEYNANNFLQVIRNCADSRAHDMYVICFDFFGCLSDAVSYIHANLTKHMDIKPQNILIRARALGVDDMWITTLSLHLWDPYTTYEVFIADFGIARSYDKPEDVLTDGSTPFTCRYAAPEVVKQDKRELSANVFSLGCVFLEFFASLCEAGWNHSFPFSRFGTRLAPRERQLSDTYGSRTPWSKLQEILNANSKQDSSYQANIVALRMYYRSLTAAYLVEVNGFPVLEELVDQFSSMISVHPDERPTSKTLSQVFWKKSCCRERPCQLEAFSDREVTVGDEDASETSE